MLFRSGSRRSRVLARSEFERGLARICQPHCAGKPPRVSAASVGRDFARRCTGLTGSGFGARALCATLRARLRPGVSATAGVFQTGGCQRRACAEPACAGTAGARGPASKHAATGDAQPALADGHGRSWALAPRRHCQPTDPVGRPLRSGTAAEGRTTAGTCDRACCGCPGRTSRGPPATETPAGSRRSADTRQACNRQCSLPENVQS